LTDSGRGALRLLIALGYLGGVVLLLLLLTKDNADALAARIGFTVASAIVLGLVVAAGARLLERPEPSSLWGCATLLIAVVTFVVVMAEIWPEHIPRHEVRLGVMVVISILLGGGALVLGDEREGESREIRVARRVALLSLVALGAFTVLVASDVEVGPRWFGVAATVFLVAALSPPLLRLALEEGSGTGDQASLRRPASP